MTHRSLAALRLGAAILVPPAARCLGVLLKAEDELSAERHGAPSPRNLLRLPDGGAAENYLHVLPRQVA